METKADNEHHGETSEKSSGQHKNSGRQTVDEIDEIQKKMKKLGEAYIQKLIDEG